MESNDAGSAACHPVGAEKAMKVPRPMTDEVAAMSRPRKRRSSCHHDGECETPPVSDSSAPSAPLDHTTTSDINVEAGADKREQEYQFRDNETQHYDTEKSKIHRAGSCTSIALSSPPKRGNQRGHQSCEKASCAVSDESIRLLEDEGNQIRCGEDETSSRALKRIKSESSLLIFAGGDEVSTRTSNKVAPCSCAGISVSSPATTFSESVSDLEKIKQLDLESQISAKENQKEDLFTESSSDRHEQIKENSVPVSSMISEDGSSDEQQQQRQDRTVQSCDGQQTHTQQPLLQMKTRQRTQDLDEAAEKGDDEDVPIEPIFGIPPHPQTCPNDMSPDEFIGDTVYAYLGYKPKIVEGLSLPSPGFFSKITEKELAAYDNELVEAVRENQIDDIRRFHAAGRSLSCSNRFGESLIHMACRRGYADTVIFLLEEAQVSVRIRDDCGRTPLHDACWNQGTQYDIVDCIIRLDPPLLCISDKRGHTPFAYARRQHWAVWRQFLFDRTDWIVSGFARKEVKDRFYGR